MTTTDATVTKTTTGTGQTTPTLWATTVRRLTLAALAVVQIPFLTAMGLAAAGTVLVASHDRWLRRGWTGETLHL